MKAGIGFARPKEGTFHSVLEEMKISRGLNV